MCMYICIYIYILYIYIYTYNTIINRVSISIRISITIYHSKYLLEARHGGRGEAQAEFSTPGADTTNQTTRNNNSN